jgi:phospholipid/cholesterol/gamma-HCH transport system permease protein
MLPARMDGGGPTILELEGRIDRAWMEANGAPRLERLLARPPRQVTVDMARVTALDSTAAGILGVLHRRVVAGGGSCAIEGANEAARTLLRVIAEAAEPPARPAPPGVLEEVGRRVAGAAEGALGAMNSLGQCLLSLPWAFGHARRVRWADGIRTAATSGLDALPVALLLGFIIGWIIAYEVLPPMQTYGASFVMPNVMGVAMVRELGPLITAILIAGRSGSAFAAELGTMKVTQELDAYTTFGIDPVRYLVAPRILGLMVTMPMLSWFMTIAGMLGGYLVLVSQTDMTIELYMQGVKDSVDLAAFALATLKVVVFGFIVGTIGCSCGLRTREGPSAVGDSATRAVVTSIVVLIVTDGVFAAVYYALGV